MCQGVMLLTALLCIGDMECERNKKEIKIHRLRSTGKNQESNETMQRISILKEWLIKQTGCSDGLVTGKNESVIGKDTRF